MGSGQGGAQRAQGCVGDGRVLQPDHLALEVRGANERQDAERLSHLSGEDANPDEIQLGDALQHPLRDPLLEDLAFES